jgi:acyl-CoA synthetase (AMP-forming)/AMP-acid ligase II
MNLTQLLKRNQQQRPHQDALVYCDQTWSYQELALRVEHLAGALRQLGIDEGERVAMMSLNSAKYVEYIFSVPWAGGVLNPVNTRWSATEIAYSLEDSQTHILIVDDTFTALIPEVKSKAPILEHVIYAGEGIPPAGMLSYEELISTASPIEDQYRHGDDLAGIFYTGGTTGFPKGVMLSHTNLICSTFSFALSADIPSGARLLHAAPMFHLADLASLFTGFLREGTQVVIPAFDAKAVSQAVRNHHVTDMLLVPTMVQMLLDAPDFSATDFSALKRILYGASPMPLSTIDKAFEKLPHIDFIQAYGMTELAPIASISSANNHTSETRASGRIGSAGLAGPLQEIRIVDKNGKTLPSGTVGEIMVRGPNVMQGYWRKPEQTAEAIADGWMRTGDGGYLDSGGYLYVVDRVKDMIITGGENVYSAEVENIISQHPLVNQCAVIGIPSDDWGESVHAVLVAEPSSQAQYNLDIDTLRNFCKEHIAGYKCPSSLEFVQSLPLSGAGKVLKAQLREPFWESVDKGVA